MAKSPRPLVSVIIPAYNVEKCIDACIRSVAEQSYDNLEIILVDDKSPDGAGKICDEWAKKDKRVQVIHKPKNEGLNMARATGFKRATGEYITFVDSDDLFHKDNIKLSLEMLGRHKADAVVYAFAEFSDATVKSKGPASAPDTPYEVRVFDTKERVVKYAILGEDGFPDAYSMTAWGKMYSRKLVEGVNWRDANFRAYEDNFWTPQALIGAKKIVLLSKQLYFYRRNEQYGAVSVALGNKLVGNTFNDKPVGYLEFIDLLCMFYRKLAKKHGVDITAGLEELRYYQTWWRLGNLVKAGLLGEENNLEYIKDVWLEHQRRDIETAERYAAENARLNAELAGLLGIKRSARLFVGNIKRRIAKSR